VRRPTIILNNGEDAQNITLYCYGGATVIERGYNALIFEGPGQGSMLFERQVPFRYDWENQGDVSMPVLPIGDREVGEAGQARRGNRAPRNVTRVGAGLVFFHHPFLPVEQPAERRGARRVLVAPGRGHG
jgi:hypothetical protein